MDYFHGGKFQKGTKSEYFLYSFSGTGARTKCRFRHKTGTDRNQAIQYRLRKVLIITFFRPVLAGPIQSVQALCLDRHFVLVPMLLEDRKKRCIFTIFLKNHTKNSSLVPGLILLQKVKKIQKSARFPISNGTVVEKCLKKTKKNVKMN